MNSQPVYSYRVTSRIGEGGDAPPGAIFPYWSFTKTAIAICALQLVERSKLTLDVRLPQQPFTLRHLLQHTSGLPDYGPLPAYHAAVARQDEPWSRQMFVDAALAQGMLFEPGDGWSYSNIGYGYVRDLIEKTTGQSIGSMMSDHLCEPLGLSTVEFWDTTEQSRSLHWKAAKDYDPRWVFHGCLIGSAADAARMLHALFEGQLLGSDSLTEMLGTLELGGLLPGRPWVQCGYALGLMSGEMASVGRAIGHSGAGPFSVNAVYHFPDRPDPVTVAYFTDGTDEGVAEFAAKAIAVEA
ncbi:MAG: serine hydrolase domain-containing protein [Pseudomonadota bacterium]